VNSSYCREAQVVKALQPELSMIIEGFWKKEKRDTIFIVLAVVITVRSDRNTC
jgi:hypothetical protein